MGGISAVQDRSSFIAFREHGGRQFRERADRYFSLTDIAAAAGKLIADYLRLESTKGFLRELSLVMGIPITELVETRWGGTPSQKGTWGHPHIAIHVALWASPALQVAVTGWMLEKLQGEAGKRRFINVADEPNFGAKMLADRKQALIEFVAAHGGEVNVARIINGELHWTFDVRETVIRSLKRDGLLEERSEPLIQGGRPARILKLADAGVAS